MSTRPQYHLDLGSLPPLMQNQSRSNGSTATSSPVEQSASGGTRSQPPADGTGLGGMNNSAPGGVPRLGAGSPSHDYSSGNRYYPRRARELASEGSGRSMWGPPTASGLSTPLRETIPESPGDDDTFPDLGISAAESTPGSNLPTRSASLRAPRSRAGTVPSQFPGIPGTSSKSSRPTPSTSPFRTPSASISSGIGRSNSSSSTAGRSALLLSRIRAGSMPQRASLLAQSQSPFGSSVLGPNWHSTRDRASTHSGAQTKDQDQDFIKDLADTDVKTLDYLGLVDRPNATSTRSSDDFNMDAYIANFQRQQQFANFNPYNRNANRYRSYSVNAKEKYADEEDLAMEQGMYSGAMTPSELIAANIAATQAQIHQHNLEVQAFANQASSSRPRARTAGALDSPASRAWRNHHQPGSELGYNRLLGDADYQGLADSVQAMQLQGSGAKTLRVDQDQTSEGATRALWLGNIPASTTTSSLKVIFDPFGKIESARVLTNKSCGFVNFEQLDSAMRARQQLNGKEIFPGAGPVRIGYAKALSSSGTPSGNEIYPSPSPDPFGAKQSETGVAANAAAGRRRGDSTTAPRLDFSAPPLTEARNEILSIIKDFGATTTEQSKIAELIDRAVSYSGYKGEIPPIAEPSTTRMHDAPRLRDIRKRIDNGSCSASEIENVAMQMLPEIAELSSDYLGNTVVQKLFENCTESTKEAMLQEIYPHLAGIGVHKNGTWAAQKIIDVARTDAQQQMIVQALQPYGVALFLDQYGNYVLQCCLKFVNFNNFIFEIMLTRLWEVAQGRFGARAMRACLESHHATKDQQRLLAAAIALHSVQLATNTNGALLLTWFLDTCNFPHRRKALAPRLIPYLVQLCTHKVAYLTVLKIINQRNEPDARDMILQALFFSANDATLEDILRDSTCGSTLIFKILTTPFLEETIRPDVQERIRIVLTNIKATPNQGYKRLMEEVGLSTRNQSSTRDAVDNAKSNEGVMAAGPSSINLNGTYLPQPVSGQQLGIPVAQSAPQFDTYAGSEMGPGSFAPNAAIASPGGLVGMGPQHAMQYQQSLYASGRPPTYSMGQTMVGDVNAAAPMDLYRNNVGRPPMNMPAGGPLVGTNTYGPSAGYNQMMSLNGARGQGMWQQQYAGNAYVGSPQQGLPQQGLPQQGLPQQGAMGQADARGRTRR